MLPSDNLTWNYIMDVTIESEIFYLHFFIFSRAGRFYRQQCLDLVQL